MMKNIEKCPECGAVVEEGTMFCRECGYRLKNADVGTKKDMSVQTGENLYTEYTKETSGYVGAENTIQRNAGSTANYFVDSDEYVVRTLGNGYLQNIVSSGGATKTTAVLTQKRLYFGGVCFEKSARSWKKVKVSKIIDLEDITGTGFVNVSSILLLILTVLGFIGFIAMVILLAMDDLSDHFIEAALSFLFTGLPGIIFMLLWLKKDLHFLMLNMLAEKSDLM